MLRRTLAGAALAAATIVTVGRAQQAASAAPPDSAVARRIVALVEKAATLVQREGKAAFPEMRRRGSEWWDGTTYVFAYDDDLNILLQPAVPAREGTNPGAERDVNGKAFHEELRRVARTGAGWVDYMLPRPGQTQPARKWSYVRAVTIDGKPGFVGAGSTPTDDAPGSPNRIKYAPLGARGRARASQRERPPAVGMPGIVGLFVLERAMWTKEHRVRHDARLKHLVSDHAIGEIAGWLERADPPRSGRRTPILPVLRRSRGTCGWAVAGPPRRMATLADRLWLVQALARPGAD